VKIKSYCTLPKYKFGFQVPRNYNEAFTHDQHFGNNKWRETTHLEMELMDEYEVFVGLGHKPLKINYNQLKHYKHIHTHLVFDVKHDGHHKA
jgi:hypothetical protein